MKLFERVVVCVLPMRYTRSCDYHNMIFNYILAIAECKLLNNCGIYKL